MITISLCMIVKNEQDTLARCLKSVKNIVDEIIIVDSGSSDKTKEIAANFTPNIYDFKWIDDFSAARNYSFSKATKEYIFWLDADDVILEEDRLKLINLKQTMDKNIDVVMMKYNYSFDSQGNVTLSHFRERLLKRRRHFKWIDPVHECIVFEGNILRTDICITHKKIHSNSRRNLIILQKMMADGKKFSSRNLFYYARELHLNKIYDHAIIYFSKFLETEEGTENENIHACIDLADCYNSINDKKNYLKTLLRCFEYDVPQPEVCCNLGYYYKDIENYEKAIFWFELATHLKRYSSIWVTVRHDYWGYIPYVELSICNFKIGNVEAAIKYNNKAAECKPNDSLIKNNKKFLEDFSSSLLKQV